MRSIANTCRVLFVASLSLACACSDDKKVGAEPPELDAEAADAGASEEFDAETDCTPVPDHLQLINAPTSSEKVDKQPVLPLLKADGTLPPLP